jgi:Large polyvalent protein-associated domain 7
MATQPETNPISDQNHQPQSTNIFIVKVGNQSKPYTDAQKAGAAYFAANPEKTPRPSVIHSENNRERIMASTEVHGTYMDGQTRYFKTLPDVLPIDKAFQAGFYGALEKSVRKRLQTLNIQASENKAAQPLKLDDRLASDLGRFANFNQEKALKNWQKYAPEGMAIPTYLENPSMAQNSQSSVSRQQPQENVIAFYDRSQEKTASNPQQTPPIVPEQADSHENPQPKQAGNQDVPERVASRYLRLKNQYYFQDKTLAFEDGGKKLKLETENITVIRDAIAIAEDRRWQSITVSGTDNFKHQVWREASLKGIEVVGYQPTKFAEAELLKAMTARDSKNQATERQPKQRDDVTTGVLLAHGADHYKHDPNQGKSYFVKLDVEGQAITKWGADFKRAFADSQSQPQIGDTVVLSNVGKQSMNIPAKTRDEDGNTVETQKTVQKTTWRIEKATYQTALEEHAEALRTGKEIEQKVIAQIPQVAAAITAAKLGEKIAEQAHVSGVIKSEDEKSALVYLIREGLASALEKGKKITAPEIKEQGKQATIDANSVFNDHKPPIMTQEPAKQEQGISR